MIDSYYELEDQFVLDEQAKMKAAADAKASANDVKLGFVSAYEWDKMSRDFADIIPEQLGSFNVGHWGEENLEFLTFRQDLALVGGAVMIVRKIPLTGSGIAILKWGPVFQKLGTKFDVALCEKIIWLIKEEYCRKRNFHLTIMPSAKPDVADKIETTLTELDFVKGAGLAAPERYLVNLQDGAEALMTSLDQKWRYNLKKALKNEFEIKIVDPREGLPKFLSLYQQMIERKQFMDASAIDALEKTIYDSPEHARPMMVFVSYEGRVTAGGVFHVMGDMASYMFGATDDRALRLKAGYVLHWWVVEHLCKQEQIQWYDLGGNDLDKGLHQFKKGFVGKSGKVLLSPHRYHFAKSILSKLVGFGVFQIRDGLSFVKRGIHMIRRKH